MTVVTNKYHLNIMYRRGETDRPVCVVEISASSVAAGQCPVVV